MMTETVVTMDGSSNNAANNPRQVPTVKTEPGQQNPLTSIRINVDYFRTIPGIIKLVQLFFGIICMACASPPRLPATHWFMFVVVTSFIGTLLWTFVYLLSIREALKLPINWIFSELLNTGIVTILYMIAFISQLSVWTAFYGNNYFSPNVAAGVFGIFNTIAYAAGTYFLYIEWKSSTTQ
ncbi:CKLF-like MARVEL transmembrane domain-containing protein 4 [Prorops nasuta]|uniref:CKLF-like MARVEL transmembrane domain-containing protein 4 n=1 Tax=Prorops nasuta TaxID=863751 RepID=UPI0034CEF8DF